MLARLEWNEPERREPLYPRLHPEVNVWRTLAFCAVAAIIWVASIITFLDWLSVVSVEHQLAHFARLH